MAFQMYSRPSLSLIIDVKNKEKDCVHIWTALSGVYKSRWQALWASP